MAEPHRRPATVRMLRGRANDRCEICGVRPRKVQIHHRKPRGMGGSKIKDMSAASNLLHLCVTCHLRLVEVRRALGYRMGWLVHRYVNCREVPVKLWDGWWYLDDAGHRLTAPDPEADPGHSGPAAVAL